MKNIVLVVATAVCTCTPAWSQVAAGSKAQSIPAQDLKIAQTDCADFQPYSSDPNHLWNRVQRELLVRTAPDATLWGCDEVDPLLWYETRHILSGDKYLHATKLLDEFIASHGERMVHDPIQRALFQRNLWAVFLWVTNGTNAEPQREELARRIAVVIRAVALTTEQIDRLPRNLLPGARVDEELEFPDHRAGWLLISRDDENPAAVSHAASLPRSAFFVYLKLPAGSTNSNYIDVIRQYSIRNHGVQCEDHPCDAPQFPVGTEVALVRRALLIDKAGRAVLSPITESVQLRKYLAIDPGMPVYVHRPGDQLRAEFRLSQKALLQGKPSLRRIAENDADFPVFAAHGADWFEQRSNPLVRALSTERPFGLKGSTLKSCIGCHSMPGVASFTTYSRSHFVAPGEPMFVLIHASDEEQEMAKQRHALESTAGWKKLQAMMAHSSPSERF